MDNNTNFLQKTTKPTIFVVVVKLFFSLTEEEEVVVVEEEEEDMKNKQTLLSEIMNRFFWNCNNKQTDRQTDT